MRNIWIIHVALPDIIAYKKIRKYKPQQKEHESNTT